MPGQVYATCNMIAWAPIKPPYIFYKRKTLYTLQRSTILYYNNINGCYMLSVNVLTMLHSQQQKDAKQTCEHNNR